MTFMPQPTRDGSPQPIFRIVLFWLLMIVLAVVLWEMSSANPHGKNVRTLTYSDFLEQVDRNNVSAAKYFLAQNTAETQGQLREPAEQFSVTVPKEAVPNLTDQLRKQGSRIEVSQSNSSGWTSILVNFAPLALLVAFWIFMMKQPQLKREGKS
jgi:cell division protease FtsH